MNQILLTDLIGFLFAAFGIGVLSVLLSAAVAGVFDPLAALPSGVVRRFLKVWVTIGATALAVGFAVVLWGVR